MANPLAAFRKHQKTLLLVAALGAMVAFGILPVMSDFIGTGTGGGPQLEDTVAVSWNGRSIKESELATHRAIRQHLRNYQEAIIQQTMQRGAQPRKVVVPNTAADESLVQSILLAEEAERMGIHVGDDAVIAYLTEQLANDTAGNNELAALLRQVTRGNLTQRMMMDALQRELAANQVQVLANAGAYTGGIADTAMSPGQSFEYFKRLRRKMEAEVIAIPVADYVDQVTEKPSDAEISALYEDYKETLPAPALPTPGFKQPARASFQVLKADYQTMLDREKAKLTDQQVEEYYEANKNTSYRKVSLPSTDDLKLDDTTDAEGTDEVEGATQTPTDESDAETAPSSEEDTISESNAAEETDSASEAAEDTAEATNSEADAPVETPSDSADDDLTPPSLSHQDEDTSTDQDTTTEQEVIADDAAAAPASDDGTSDTNDTPTDDANNGAADTEDPLDALINEGATDGSKTAGSDTAPAGEKVEYYPLEEVRDDIKTVLASPLARAAVTEAVDSAMSELRSYFEDYLFWESTPEDEREGGPPAFPNLQSLVDAGMILSDIPMISVLDVDEYEIGSAYDINYGTMQRISFPMVAFNPSLSKFDPRKISSASDANSKFVFWKTDEKESYTPSLEEATPAITQHWKMKKAIDLAKKHGQDLIKKAQSAEQSLAVAYENDDEVTVADTGEFSWMTGGQGVPAAMGAPRLGFVGGVEFAGDGFMGDVSKLDAGQFTVTTNYPETTVYVVYMKSVAASQEDLRQMFLTEGITTPLIQIARRESALAASDWYSTFEKQQQLKWTRPPQQDPGR